jgi:hypothetical protein
LLLCRPLLLCGLLGGPLLLCWRVRWLLLHDRRWRGLW